MNKLFLAIGTAAFTLFMLPASATAQKLSPNAEIMLLEKQKTGKMRLPGKSDAAEAKSYSKVSAYIKYNDIAALDQLEELGVKINSRFDGFVTAAITIDQLEEVGRLATVDHVSVSSPVNMTMDFARKHTGIDDMHSNTDNAFDNPFTGKGVIVGIIDSGLEYPHAAFRDGKGGTRIKAVWNQLASGNAPEGYDYGSEIIGSENIMGKKYDTFQTYHGSHTTGIAAGYDEKSKYYGVAKDADIVFVSFDESEDARIADAIEYIFDYADKEGKPCVINMSLGSHFGPHDGTSYLDKVIDQRTGPGRIVVGAVGNEGEFRIHGSKTLTAGDTQFKSMLTFNENVSHKIHYLDIWGTPGTNFKVNGLIVESLRGRIVYTSRGVDSSNPDNRKNIDFTTIDECGADAEFVVSAEISPVNGAPHASLQVTVNSLSTGRMIGVLVEGEEGQTIHVWNASMHNLSSNGKSGWVDGNTDYTVGEIGGTSNSIITVGSYDARNTVPWLDGTYSRLDERGGFEQFHKSTFSSCGPTVDGRCAPHLLAPGCAVISAYNKYYFLDDSQRRLMSTAKTTISGEDYYYGYDIGTSMSSPVVAGTIALMLEADPTLTPKDALKHLQATADKDAFMGTLPNNQYGAGRLNASKAMLSLLGKVSNESIGIDSDAEAKAWVIPGTCTLSVYNPEGECDALVYNVSGARVASIPLSGISTTADASAWGNGIFIVKVGSRSFKLSL